MTEATEHMPTQTISKCHYLNKQKDIVVEGEKKALKVHG